MPTKKPIIQAVINEKQHDKFLYIANKERRSKSQMATIAIEEFITNYEKKHGTINIDTNNVIELKPFA